jgi:hypothetical protein
VLAEYIRRGRTESRFVDLIGSTFWQLGRLTPGMLMRIWHVYFPKAGAESVTMDAVNSHGIVVSYGLNPGLSLRKLESNILPDMYLYYNS